MEKVFKILMNGELFLHSLSAEEVRAFFNRMANKRSYDGAYYRVSTEHGLFSTIEDQWVFEQYDSVNDAYGECYHRVVKDVDGNVLSDVMGGDWCATQPNAYGVTPERRSRASLYYAERDFIKTAAAAAALM